jgi:hypothetical protein
MSLDSGMMKLARVFIKGNGSGNGLSFKKKDGIHIGEEKIANFRFYFYKCFNLTFVSLINATLLKRNC